MFMRRDLGTAAALPPRRGHWAWTVALCIVTLVIASWSTPAAFATGDVPTVTINQAASQPDPDSETPIMFDVKFSEPVEAFVRQRYLLCRVHCRWCPHSGYHRQRRRLHGHR